MTPTESAFLLAGVQTLLILALAVDKWVHRVTGATPLEARIAELEKLLAQGNDRFSKKMSEMTTYLDERRLEAEGVRAGLAELRGEVRAMRGYRREES